MKSFGILMLLGALAIGSLPASSLGQDAQRANQDAQKRLEKIKEKVSKLKIGETVNVDLLDGKHYKGKLTRTDDKSLEIVDKQNRTVTASFNDISSVYPPTHVSPVLKGVLIGLAALAAIITIGIIHDACTFDRC